MDGWLSWNSVGTFVVGVVAGAIIPNHYTDALKRHRGRQAAARYLLHHLSRGRELLTGICTQIDTTAPTMGPGVVQHNITALEEHRTALGAKPDLLFDLHDQSLHQRVERLIEQWRTSANHFRPGPGVWTISGALDTAFMGGFRHTQTSIRSAVIPATDETILLLQALDVSFPAWILRKLR